LSDVQITLAADESSSYVDEPGATVTAQELADQRVTNEQRSSSASRSLTKAGVLLLANDLVHGALFNRNGPHAQPVFKYVVQLSSYMHTRTHSYAPDELDMAYRTELPMPSPPYYTSAKAPFATAAANNTSRTSTASTGYATGNEHSLPRMMPPPSPPSSSSDSHSIASSSCFTFNDDLLVEAAVDGSDTHNGLIREIGQMTDRAKQMTIVTPGPRQALEYLSSTHQRSVEENEVSTRNKNKRAHLLQATLQVQCRHQRSVSDVPSDPIITTTTGL
jgi:hypothetical protein